MGACKGNQVGSIKRLENAISHYEQIISGKRTRGNPVRMGPTQVMNAEFKLLIHTVSSCVEEDGCSMVEVRRKSLPKPLFQDLVLVRTLRRLSDDVHEVLSRILVDGGAKRGRTWSCRWWFHQVPIVFPLVETQKAAWCVQKVGSSFWTSGSPT